MGVLFANLQLFCFNYLKLSSLDHSRELFLLSLYTYNFHSPSYLKAKNIEFLNERYLSSLKLCALVSVRTGEQWSFTIIIESFLSRIPFWKSDESTGHS